MTRTAAAGFAGLSQADRAALETGASRVDVGEHSWELIAALKDAFRPTQQRRHALRGHLRQPLHAALTDIRGHLEVLYHGALTAHAADMRKVAFEQIGEALHLIQDAYSPAHTERRWTGNGGPHPIVYIRYLAPGAGAYPLERRVFPPDPREPATNGEGQLVRWGGEAVAGSREFLQLILRHFAVPSSPGNVAELRAYMDKHLTLSPHTAAGDARTELA